MATIGLDKLYYAPITESPTTGDETYGTPVMLAKAISAELSIELAEATLYADDGAAEVVKELKTASSPWRGQHRSFGCRSPDWGQVDENGVLISTSEDGGAPVAIGFRAKKANGHYKYFWFYRVKFGVPSTNLATKGDSITFSTPTIEGTVMRRNKVDGNDNHPWKAEADQDDTDIEPSVISGGIQASTNRRSRRVRVKEVTEYG
jgi:phi13 family phage major tail protein